MEGRAQADTTHRSLLPSLTEKRKKNKSGYFVATPRIAVLCGVSAFRSLADCISVTVKTRCLVHLRGEMNRNVTSKFYVIHTAHFLTFRILTNKMQQLKHNFIVDHVLVLRRNHVKC